MIPKIIHYCWFGHSEKPDSVIKMIESWKKFCPDYKIKEWNENNFDINYCTYTKEAYSRKKWAFVSDVARLYALYHEGGIYLDTDVEVVKSLDKFLSDDGFLGFEGEKSIATSIIGSIPNNNIIKHFLESYHHMSFFNDNSTNVTKLTLLLTSRYNLILNGDKQTVNTFHVYPSDYFSPFDYINGKLTKTINTHAIHWFSQSWIPQNPIKKKLSQFYHRLFNIKLHIF